MNMRKTLVAAALVLAASAQVQAATATYNFGGVIEEGPLLGLSFSGSFSFDDATLNVATEWLPVSALQFTFNSVNYTLAGAEAGSTSVSFSSGMVIGVDGVWGDIDNGVTISTGFGNLTFGDTAGNIGSYTVSAVPEPSTWLMGVAGLAFMGAVVRRRRAA